MYIGCNITHLVTHAVWHHRPGAHAPLRPRARRISPRRIPTWFPSFYLTIPCNVMWIYIAHRRGTSNALYALVRCKSNDAGITNCLLIQLVPSINYFIRKKIFHQSRFHRNLTRDYHFRKYSGSMRRSLIWGANTADAANFTKMKNLEEKSALQRR